MVIGEDERMRKVPCLNEYGLKNGKKKRKEYTKGWGREEGKRREEKESGGKVFSISRPHSGV